MTHSPFLALLAMAGSTAACKISSACSQAFHPLPKVPQELQEPDIPWQAGFAETTQDPQIGLQSGKQALRPMLMHVTPCVLFLGVLHARVHGALHRLRATGRGGREATAGWTARAAAFGTGFTVQSLVAWITTAPWRLPQAMLAGRSLS